MQIKMTRQRVLLISLLSVICGLVLPYVGLEIMSIGPMKLIRPCRSEIILMRRSGCLRFTSAICGRVWPATASISCGC